jgi:hypothetical protein
MLVEGKTNMTKRTLVDIPSVPCRLAVVIGANSGIGWRTALELAQAESEVIVASGTEAKGSDAVDRIWHQISAGEGADGGARPGEFGRYGEGDRQLANRPPALPDGAFVGTSLLQLVAVLTGGSLGPSPSHRLQGETHA